jgi:hypothetical protein
MVHGMPNLLDRNCASGEGSFLAIVAFKLDTMLLIQDCISGDGRMMATNYPRDEIGLAFTITGDLGSPNLLREQQSFSNISSWILPFPKKQFSQKRVKWLLL